MMNCRYREEESTEGHLGQAMGRRSPVRSPGRATGRTFYSLRRQARMESDDLVQQGSEANTEVRERERERLLSPISLLSNLIFSLRFWKNLTTRESPPLQPPNLRALLTSRPTSRPSPRTSEIITTSRGPALLRLCPGKTDISRERKYFFLSQISSRPDGGPAGAERRAPASPEVLRHPRNISGAGVPK